MYLEEPVVLYKAKLAEFVHKKTDSRTRSTDHLREHLVANLWNYLLGFAVFPKLANSKSVRASLFSLGLKSWSSRSSSIRMVRASKYDNNRFEKTGSW